MSLLQVCAQALLFQEKEPVLPELVPLHLVLLALLAGWLGGADRVVERSTPLSWCPAELGKGWFGFFRS